MCGQPASVFLVFPAGKVIGKFAEIRIQKSQQGTKNILLAAVRGSGDKNHVPVAVFGQPAHKLVALLAGTVA